MLNGSYVNRYSHKGYGLLCIGALFLEKILISEFMKYIEFINKINLMYGRKYTVFIEFKVNDDVYRDRW